MNKKCIGCGIILQTENPDKPGYIPKTKINNSSYCERCFKIINYNTPSITHLSLDNMAILNDINNHATHIFYIIDFLSLSSETISIYHQITIPKVLIISKIDTIPKSLKESKISNWIKKIYNVTEPIIFLSAKKRTNIYSIYRYLNEHQITSTYIAGFTNSGKSTLINALMPTDSENLTTSLIPNTTYDFVTRTTKDGYVITDCPGFIPKETFYQEDDFSLIKKISPTKTIKPQTYQLKKGSGIELENKLKIASSNSNNITLYISNSLNLNRLYNPFPYSQKIHIPANTDLVIKGVGFINIKKPCILYIATSTPNILETRPSLFQGE